MSTDETGRRQKVVMALGIATIILFSANLLTVLAKHFLPDHGLPFLSKQEVVIAEAPVARYEFRVHSEHADRNDHRHKHRIILNAPSGVSTIYMDELDRDIAKLEEAARRLEREVSQEMSQLNAKQIRVRTMRALELAEVAAAEARSAQTIHVIQSGPDEAEVEIVVDGSSN